MSLRRFSMTFDVKDRMLNVRPADVETRSWFEEVSDRFPEIEAAGQAAARMDEPLPARGVELDRALESRAADLAGRLGLLFPAERFEVFAVFWE